MTSREYKAASLPCQPPLPAGLPGCLQEAELHQAWDLYYHVFKRINKQLPSLTTLDLQYVAPALVRAQVGAGPGGAGTTLLYLVLNRCSAEGLGMLSCVCCVCAHDCCPHRDVMSKGEGATSLCSYSTVIVL